MMTQIHPYIIYAAQLLMTLSFAFILLKKQLATFRKQEAETSKTEAETESVETKNLTSLLEEYRKFSSESINALQLRYDEKILTLQDELFRANKKIDELSDELKSRETLANRRQEQLDNTIHEKEYLRGRLHETELIIEKHLKKIA
jgi:phenylalanyl-tRNA synthetase alpha subunit